MELLTSELVTNAVIHAGGAPEVVVHLGDGVVRVEVYDDEASPPMLRRPDTTAASGRGIAIVDELAETWGVEPIRDDGKRVWFEVLR